MTSPRSPTSSSRVRDAGLLRRSTRSASTRSASARSSTSSRRARAPIDCKRDRRHLARLEAVGRDQDRGAKLAEQELVHGGQPMMAWCVGNAKVEPRGNAISITKQASGTAKIDPLMALFMPCR
jgi:hypothetical protein